MRTDGHTFLAVGMCSAIVIAIGALVLAIWALFEVSQMREQVDRADDAATPSLAATLNEPKPEPKPEPEPEPEPDDRHEYRVIAGYSFKFVKQETESAPEREVAVREAVTDPGQGLQGLQGRRPLPHPPGAARRPPLPHLPQRREAP